MRVYSDKAVKTPKSKVRHRDRLCGVGDAGLVVDVWPSWYGGRREPFSLSSVVGMGGMLWEWIEREETRKEDNSAHEPSRFRPGVNCMHE